MRHGVSLAVCGLALGFVATSFGSYVEVSIHKRDIVGDSRQWRGTINVDVSGIAGIASMDMANTNDGVVPAASASDWSSMTFDYGSSYYSQSPDVATLDAFVANQLTSNFWLRVNYASDAPSVYGFTFAKANVTRSLFAGIPQITSPANGDANVLPGATITWTAPTGLPAGDFVVAEHDNGIGTKGVLSITAVSWTPGDLQSNERIRVSYVVLDTLDTTGPITWYSGAEIIWGNSEFSTNTDGTPLMAYLSQQQLSVNVPEPTALGLMLTAGILLVRRRRNA